MWNLIFALEMAALLVVVHAGLARIADQLSHGLKGVIRTMATVEDAVAAVKQLADAVAGEDGALTKIVATLQATATPDTQPVIDQINALIQHVTAFPATLTAAAAPAAGGSPVNTPPADAAPAGDGSPPPAAARLLRTIRETQWGMGKGTDAQQRHKPR